MSEEYNADELISPEWMNKDFFEKVLRKSEDDQSIQVLTFKIEPASKANEHFASIIFRAKITFSQKLKNDSSISIIIKTKPFLDGVKKDMFGDDNTIFEVETKMYLEILPEIQKLINLSGDNSILAPRMIYSSTEPAQILIFEDICPKGFSTCEEKGLSLELTKRAVSRLGQYHAASMVMDSNQNNKLKDYNQGIFKLNLGGEGLGFMTMNLKLFIEALKTWPGYEIYVEKFENIYKNFYELGKKNTLPNEPGIGYNVLNHGDFHAKNLMFKNIENPTEAELMVIDYQIGFYGSPAYDIYYTIYAMCEFESRKHFDEIVSHYYESFSTNLKKMGYEKEIPSMMDLQDELRRHGFIEVYLNICFTPFVFLDFTTIKLEELFSSNENGNNARSDLFANPELISFFKSQLPIYLEKGYFDSFKV